MPLRTAKQIILFLSTTACFWNVYGLSECTIGTTHHLITSIDLQLPSIPIGRPLPGCICQVLDEHLQPVIPGQIGELFIGGLGVFKGYFHRPELTQEALVILEDGNIYYRTGDLVVLSGSPRVLHYKGRRDFEVQLKGQRIDCREIERLLLNYPIVLITQSVVITWENLGDDFLVAYVQNQDTNDTALAKKLRTYCEEHLPAYMVPNFFVVLNRFPINSNGKLDRKVLPPPNLMSSIGQNCEDMKQLPRNKTEKIVQRMWCDLLHVDYILSIMTSFFALGGNSLQFMRLYHQYRHQFSIPFAALPFSNILINPTICGHAQYLQSFDDHSCTTSTPGEFI